MWLCTIDLPAHASLFSLWIDGEAGHGVVENIG